VGVVTTFVVLFAGAVRTGTPGITGIIVKLNAVENALEPAAFFERTCQKYCVLFNSGVISESVPLTKVVVVESLTTVDANVLIVDT
jgi:hypothetical protein